MNPLRTIGWLTAELVIGFLMIPLVFAVSLMMFLGDFWRDIWRARR